MPAKNNALPVQWVINSRFNTVHKENAILGLEPYCCCSAPAVQQGVRHFGGSGTRRLAPWKPLRSFCPGFFTAASLLLLKDKVIQRQNFIKHTQALPAVPTVTVAWEAEQQDHVRQGRRWHMERVPWGSSLTMTWLVHFSLSLAPLAQTLVG